MPRVRLFLLKLLQIPTFLKLQLYMQTMHQINAYSRWSNCKTLLYAGYYTHMCPNAAPVTCVNSNVVET